MQQQVSRRLALNPCRIGASGTKLLVVAMAGGSAPKPDVGCLIGAWLAGVRGPVRVVAAELMAMGEQGLVDVSAGRDGYTLRLRYPLDGPELTDERRFLMRELLAGEASSSTLLPRPASAIVAVDDGKLKGSRLSFERLATAVARAAGSAGSAGRIRFQRSRRARANRTQLLRLRDQMRETLRDDSVTIAPSWQLPWALLFFENDDFALWRLRFARTAPTWWEWADGFSGGSDGAGGIDAFNFCDGLHGFFAALRYSMRL